VFVGRPNSDPGRERAFKYLPPPPAGLKPPLRWGTDAGLSELLGSRANSIKSERRSFTSYFQSVDHAIDIMRRYFGSTARAFQILDAAGQASLQRDLEGLLQKRNRATDGSLVYEAEYLETVVIRS
jgi:hypothetical protein